MIGTRVEELDKQRRSQKFWLLVYGVVILVVLLAACSTRRDELDAKGGMHLVLEVDVQKALENEIDGHMERIQEDLRNKKIAYESVTRAEKHSVIIVGVPLEKQAELKDYLDRALPVYDYSLVPEAGKTSCRLTMKPTYIRDFKERIVDQTLNVLERRINALGVNAPRIQRAGKTTGSDIADKIVVELPGVEDTNRITQVLTTPAQLELKLVYPDKGMLSNVTSYPSKEEVLKAFNGVIPPGYEILSFKEAGTRDYAPTTGYVVVEHAAKLTGKYLKDATPRPSPASNNYDVHFTLDNQGREIFGRVTEANVGKLLAIVLDNKVLSAPRIHQKIDSDSAVITGQFSAEAARDLALALRSGALPAQLKLIEERHIEPSTKKKGQ